MRLLPVCSGRAEPMAILLMMLHSQGAVGSPTYLMPLEEDCSNTYDNEHSLNITCAAGHDLYRYTGLDSYYSSRSSCSTCQCGAYTGSDPSSLKIPEVQQWNYGPQCCPGFNGTECDICSTVNSCPPLRVSGKDGDNDTFVPATMCTSDLMVPANLLEAEMGKKFSCFCGGGEDALSQSACNAQGDYNVQTGTNSQGEPLVAKGETTTRLDWTFHGLGTDDSPGSITIAMNAGIHGNSWGEKDPAAYQFFYPIVWSGTLGNCVITEGNCMDVYGTDVKNKQCFNYDCGTTDISCPPKGLPSCPGGANNCENVPGTDDKYQMQKCNVLPSSGIGLKISCLKLKNQDDSSVCYYAQPGGYAPLSMTCNTGNCLYNNSADIAFSDTEIDTPRGVAYQESLLIVLVGSIMGAAIALELLRQGREVRKEKAFRRQQQRRRSVAASSEEGDTTTNPLLSGGGNKKELGRGGSGNGSSKGGGLPEEDGADVLVSNATAAAAAAGVEGDLSLGGCSGGGKGQVGSRLRSESAESGHDERRKYKGAVLSWHDMKLWVPAKASDQLSNLHGLTKQGLQAFQRDLQQGLDMHSPMHRGQGGSGDDDEEAGGVRTTQAASASSSSTAPVLLPQGSPGSPPPSSNDLAAAGGGGATTTTPNTTTAGGGDGDDGEHSLEKQILRGVSGTARRGSLTALMGPSGAGKTSLLDCLAARKPMHRVQGLVTVNGRPCPPSTMRNVSGYVAQHDVLPGVLTVREHLLFHARLRCPSSMDDQARRQRVDEVIGNLGLLKCRDTQIGNEFKRGLSGGEKRRVSVAEELVVEPGILFLDEPTTGLDSTTAMSICKTLGDIARRGTTVLLSIHQPREDIFDLFDRVLVLCLGGRVVFEGPTALVPKYLKRACEMQFVHDPKINSFLSHHFTSSSSTSTTSTALALAGVDEDAAADAAAAFTDLDQETPSSPSHSSNGKKANGSTAKRKKRKKRPGNPADLLLDVASCSKCDALADAYGNKTFQNGIPDWHAGASSSLMSSTSVGGGGGGQRRVASSQQTECGTEWEDALGPLVSDHNPLHLMSSGCASDVSDEESCANSPTSAHGSLASDHEESDALQLSLPALSAAEAEQASAAGFSSSGSLNYEDPNPVRAALNEVLMCCRLMRRPPVDAFFPPRHSASPLLQLLVLSERLVKTATRHPMLVLLQYAGALFLAVCLGFIFQDVPDDLYGVQDRFGLLFFLPFCLVLLGMSSLPVWRDEHILFTHEQGNKRIYGFPAYFLSVLLFDLVLVRTVPPTFFALITYNMVGLNQHCDACLLYFAVILILTNVISALIAMAVGAFRFSTSFSNLVGALLALLFALFAGFLVSKKSHPNLWVFKVDPMAYSYEALMINQFGNQLTADGNEYFYVINGSWCAKGLETVYPTGNQLLSTFGFSNSQRDMNDDIYALWTGALYCTALAFGVLVASAQAPHYAAAWQRMCQVSPLGLLFALLSACARSLARCVTGKRAKNSSGGGGSGGPEEASSKSNGTAHEEEATGSSLVGSILSSSSTSLNRKAFQNLPESESGEVVNRSRHQSSSEDGFGSGSFEVEDDDEFELEDDNDDFPDQPRSRIVSFEDEDPELLAAAQRGRDDGDDDGGGGGGGEQNNGSRRGAAANGSGGGVSAGAAGSMAAAVPGELVPGQWPKDDEARRKSLKALLRRQLRNPLGGDDLQGVRRNPNTDCGPPPMVLSFHNVCLSVPQPPDLAKSLKKHFTANKVSAADAPDKRGVPSSLVAQQQQQEEPMEVVPLSATLEASEVSLGMNVMRSPQSGLAIVRKVMPQSWAQRKGVKPGDTLVGVGSVRVHTYDEMAPALRSSPRPVRVHFLRRRRAANATDVLMGGGGGRSGRTKTRGGGGLFGWWRQGQQRVEGVLSAVGLGGTRYDPHGGPENHRNLKPILKNVSGSTLSSHRVMKPPPGQSNSGSNGGAGSGGHDQAPQLRSLPGARATQQSHTSGTAQAQAQAHAAVLASERLPAMVCGIMGPSGAGKTSLLDVLAGRKTVGVVTGCVRLNGREMSPTEMRLLSGYVVQEDILPPMLTVRECLEFQAKLRVPTSTSSSSASASYERSGSSGGGSSGSGGGGCLSNASKVRVEAVLKRMKLKRIAGTVVGGSFQRGISGGEKRRLSVAIELLSEPAVLFLDEPTTGQDSTTAVMLCKALKKIARDGTTVVMSIHQPRVDIFEMMTQIVFLTREGRVAYCGPTHSLAAYIQADLGMGGDQSVSMATGQLQGVGNKSSSNPADDLLDVMSVLEPQLLVDRYGNSFAGAAQSATLGVLAKAYFDPDEPDADDDGAGALMMGRGGGGTGLVARASDRQLMKRLVAERGKHVSLWPTQFYYLSVRALRNTVRNPFPFFLHGVTAVVASVLIGFTFENIHSKDDKTAGTQDRFGIMFFLLLYLSLLSLTSLPLWRDDQQLFVSERGSGIYGTSAYVMASMLFDVLPYRILPPLAFALISYPLIDLNDTAGHQFSFFLILCATNLTTSLICMLIGVLTSSNAAANAAGSLAMLTSLLFCGFLLNKKRIPAGFEWILWWSPGNYAYEALVENEFTGLEDLYITSVLADEVIRAGPFTGTNLAHCFGFEDRVTSDVWTLLVMAGVYFGAVMVVMELFIKEKR